MTNAGSTVPVTPTLVVSDLHLGGTSGVDLLARDGIARARLLDALEGVERLVVAGDLLELRHTSARSVLQRARPALQALGQRLGPDREVLVLAGNHDHRLIRPWLERSRLQGTPFGPTETARPEAVSGIAEALAAALHPARLTIAYPAAWLVDPDSSGTGGVLVTHGHYVDALWRMPTMERLAAGLVARSHRTPTATLRTPDDFERVLGPAYGWMDAIAEHTDEVRRSTAPSRTASIWASLNDRRSWRGRGLRLALPRVIALVDRMGIGPLERQVTAENLRIAGTQAMVEVADRLDLRPDHLIFGHTHRTGPLPGDVPQEWRLRHGGQLHNAGSWVHEGRVLNGITAETPYWPGHAIRIQADGVPRLEGLLDDVNTPWS